MMILPEDASLQVVAERLAAAGGQPHAEIIRVLGVALARIGALEEEVQRLRAVQRKMVSFRLRALDGADPMDALYEERELHEIFTAMVAEENRQEAADDRFPEVDAAAPL